MGGQPRGDQPLEPLADGVVFLYFGWENPDLGCGAVEDRNSIASDFNIAVGVGNFGAQQPVGQSPDLMRGAVVDAQGAGSAANIDAQGLPRERLLEDPLA